MEGVTNPQDMSTAELLDLIEELQTPHFLAVQAAIAQARMIIAGRVIPGELETDYIIANGAEIRNRTAADLLTLDQYDAELKKRALAEGGIDSAIVRVVYVGPSQRRVVDNKAFQAAAAAAGVNIADYTTVVEKDAYVQSPKWK